MAFQVIHGDCRQEIKYLIETGYNVDSIVTDPPYEINITLKGWDGTGIAFDRTLWKLCFEILKPGSHLLSFATARHYHRVATAIEDAGFEIRDQMMWVYATGIPKSMDAGRAIDAKQGAERTEIIGIKPGHEGFANRKTQGHSRFKDGFARDWQHDPEARNRYYHETAPVTEEAKKWHGWGTALRPAHEPIIVARKPFSESTLAENLMVHSTGAINIAENRIAGNNRWPANVVHDGSEVVSDLFDSGERAGYFYMTKPSIKERDRCDHPTIKPLKLMEHLVRLVTPKGGTVLDPFAGSGTTGEAALLHGFKTILIEKEEPYCQQILSRLERYKLISFAI